MYLESRYKSHNLSTREHALSAVNDDTDLVTLLNAVTVNQQRATLLKLFVEIESGAPARPHSLVLPEVAADAHLAPELVVATEFRERERSERARFFMLFKLSGHLSLVFNTPEDEWETGLVYQPIQG